MKGSLRDQLEVWRKQSADHKQVRQKKKTTQKRERETLTVRDLHELMGTGRLQYARSKGGAYRQR